MEAVVKVFETCNYAWRLQVAAEEGSG